MLFRSVSNNLEINGAGVNKGNAVQRLLHYLGYEESQLMAIGDSSNDIPMLRIARMAIAMENATQETKEVATALTDENNADGVAKAIELFL